MQCKRDLDFKNIFNQIINDLKNFVLKAHENTLQIDDSASKDYAFVLIGISGGLDSALTATLATAALGNKSVFGMFMPSQYTSLESKRDAVSLVQNLKIHYDTVEIDDILESFKKTLHCAQILTEDEEKTENQNLQARIRANLLLYKANKEKLLVLNTGNRSEILTGYYTKHGDSIGDFNLIGSLYKTEIFEFSRWINENFSDLGFSCPPINNEIIEKSPSAELKNNQKDEDDLLPYEELDEILISLNECGISHEDLKIRDGINKNSVEKVLKRMLIGIVKKNH